MLELLESKYKLSAIKNIKEEIEYISKEYVWDYENEADVKKNQTELSEIKNIIIQVKNLLGGSTS